MSTPPATPADAKSYLLYDFILQYGVTEQVLLCVDDGDTVEETPEGWFFTEASGRVTQVFRQYVMRALCTPARVEKAREGYVPQEARGKKGGGTLH